MAVMDAGGNRVGRNSVGTKPWSPPCSRPVRRDARGGHRAAGGGTGHRGGRCPEPFARRRWGWGTQDKSCLCHRSLDMPQRVVTPGHGLSLMWAGEGREAPGAHHDRNATEDPPRARHLLPEAGCHRGSAPRVGCGMPTGTEAFPVATGSREPDFGSQSTNKQHGRAEGTCDPHLPGSFPLSKAGSGAGAKASRARRGLPCAGARVKPVHHQGQPKTQRTAGRGRCRGRGQSKGDVAPRGGCKRGAGEEGRGAG